MNLQGKMDPAKDNFPKPSGLYQKLKVTPASHQKITLIAAIDENRVLGKDNKLIWHLTEDLKRFKRLTTNHAIIMGRRTFESLPKALPKRHNIVVTRNRNYSKEGVTVCHRLVEAIACASDDEQPFIIGGGQIYEQAIKLASVIELTKIHDQFEGDVFFPEIDNEEWTIINEQRMKHPKFDYSFITYIKK
mgnify:CR=1 FL=1